MWFDVRAKLAEIEGRPPATSATTATQAPAARPVSQVSQVSQHPEPRIPAFRVASVASVATPPRPKSQPAPPARAEGLDPDAFPHGTACGLGTHPRTWCGRVVSLAEWRRLTEWERHGPRGDRWNGATGRWEGEG
jgi:hypothetical protein